MDRDERRDQKNKRKQLYYDATGGRGEEHDWISPFLHQASSKRTTKIGWSHMALVF
jgi:hypothetical protein